MEREVKRQLRPRSRSNTFGRIAICLSFFLNLWTVLIYFLFPYADQKDVIWGFNYLDKTDRPITHYCFLLVYLILYVLTVWSFIEASCRDPGYVPHDKKSYDTTLLLQREQILWIYLQKIGRGVHQDSLLSEDRPALPEISIVESENLNPQHKVTERPSLLLRSTSLPGSQRDGSGMDLVDTNPDQQILIYSENLAASQNINLRRSESFSNVQNEVGAKRQK